MNDSIEPFDIPFTFSCMFIVGISLVCVTLLYLLVPKGMVIYELLRLPFWAYQMETWPPGKYRMSKHVYGPHFRQYFLCFRPTDSTLQKKHAVIYFHGGGWQFGRPEMFRPNAQVLVDQGYTVFLPSHRRLPFFDVLDLRKDAASAVKYIQDLIKSEGIPATKIVLGGMSSGGHLAGLLAFDEDLLASVGLSRQNFAGVFLLGAPLNLDGMWHSPPLRMLAGKRKGEKFRQASPMHFLRSNDTLPVFVLHAEKDGLVEFSSVLAFFEKMKELGAKNARMYTLPDMIHLDSASWCFSGHPAQSYLFSWLDEMEHRDDLTPVTEPKQTGP